MSPRRMRKSLKTGARGARSRPSSVCRRPCLHPDDNIRRALDVFGASRADTLVVTARGTEQVFGTLSEAYAARRYAQETNLAMKGVLGGG